MTMEGNAVFTWCACWRRRSRRRFSQRPESQRDDCLIPHQANLRIIGLRRGNAASMEKVIVTGPPCEWPQAASIPWAWMRRRRDKASVGHHCIGEVVGGGSPEGAVP